MSDLIIVEEICDRYGCGRHKAAAIMNKIPHFKVGNRLFARTADLEAWERDQTVYPVAKGVRKQQSMQCLIPRRRA